MYDFRPMDRQTAIEITQWHYPTPYDIYNADDVEASIECYLEPDYHYYSLWQGDELIAFRCFGEDARVRGGDYSADALDMGGGLRPDLTGRGLGTSVMQAAFEFAKIEFKPAAFRATVAGFNLRAQKVCQRVGYREIERFNATHTGREFIVYFMENAPIR